MPHQPPYPMTSPSFRNENLEKNTESRAMVVAQLSEWSLLMPEVCGSNPVIGKILQRPLLKLPIKKEVN